jgi:hypothetical protein
MTEGSRYLFSVLSRWAVDTGPTSPVRFAQTQLAPIIQGWAGNVLLDMHPSGSFMKGTAVHGGTDIDLFISISEGCTDSLGQIYGSLFTRLQQNGYAPKKQNVSINIKAGAWSVDLVPAKRQNSLSADHSLYRQRKDTWTKTNVQTHINQVVSAGRQQETRVLKLWRNQKNIEFPSFYLELAMIQALAGWNSTTSSLESRVQRCFEYLRDSFCNARFVDPANTNNMISDDLTNAQKLAIATAAGHARSAPYWQDIVQ